MSKMTIYVISSILFVLLGLRLYFYFININPIVDGQKISLEEVMLDEPKRSGANQTFYVESEGERILIKTKRFPEYHYGQTLKISGRIKFILLNDGSTVKSIQYPEIEARYSRALRPVVGIRNNLIIFFSSSLDLASSGMILGIVFGIKDYLPKEMLDKMKMVGITHITAASGMNVTIFAGSIFLLLSKIISRKKAVVLGIILIWLYAVISGLDPSIVRAGVMSSIAFGAIFFGRQNTSLWTLFLTGYLMVFVSPGILGSVGFQLSFFATLGIIVFSAKDYLMNKGKTGIAEMFREDLKTTISAQVATFPIILGVFGKFNLISIAVNILVLWCIPPIMIFGMIGALLSFVSPFFGKLIILLTLPFLKYIQEVIGFFADKQIVIEHACASWVFVFGYYLSVLAIFLFIRKNKLRKK